jgi:hypothetical protein
MASPAGTGSTPLPREGKGESPTLIPCLLLRGGQVYLPGPAGPVPARSVATVSLDPFDVVDRLVANYSLLYVVDLDGINREDPQLDYLQELSRDIGLWVDAGVRSSDQAIDILVAGARRVILSTAYLRGPNALARAWKLSTELVFEIEMTGATLTPAAGIWGTEDPIGLARIVREAGPDHLVISPRETDPDWGIVRAIASEGPTWVDGSFQQSELPRLREAGAKGGIFHLNDLWAQWAAEAGGSPQDPEKTARDDENKNRLTDDE